MFVSLLSRVITRAPKLIRETPPPQKIFREHWDNDLKNWTDLKEEITSKVESEIKRRVLPTSLPSGEEDLKLYYADLTRLINDAWNRSWRNMRHARNIKEGKARKSTSSFR